MADTDRVRRVRLTLFTLEEANRTAQEIRTELETLVQTKKELNKVQSRVGVLELTLTGATEDNPDARELKVLAARRETLGTRLHHGIVAIQRRGCIVKDLDRGLVDFYSLRGDRLIFLCWKLGEREIGHWHPIDGGFDQRRPLGVDDDED